MHFRTRRFEVEVRRCSLSAYVRAGALEAFGSLDEPGLSALDWRGKAIGRSAPAVPCVPLTEAQLAAAVVAGEAARVARDKRQPWRTWLRGGPR